MFVTGLVLAAGASNRLGHPKQLLAFQGATLLDATLSVARACGFDQLLVALGAASRQVRASVDLSNAEVVENPAYGSGCSSSISAGLRSVDDRTDGLVLLLGDQPGIDPADVARLISEHDAPMAVCRYDDGLGHPMWFRRDLFAELSELHGDKAVWRLLHSGRYDVREVPVEGVIPRDVDTMQDYAALIAGHSFRPHP
ncbi:MAG: nucleotidyltransferase family protein [Actinomycetota bacterium]